LKNGLCTRRASAIQFGLMPLLGLYRAVHADARESRRRSGRTGSRCCDTRISNGSLRRALLSREALNDAEEPGDTYQRNKLYKKVLEPENKRRTKVRISSGIDVRLGGRYLMHVELSRQEISRLFFETHNGAMVRMIKSFIEEEAREDREEDLAALRERIERRKRVAEEIAAAEAQAGEPS
jgi:hypothetical protein